MGEDRVESGRAVSKKDFEEKNVGLWKTLRVGGGSMKGLQVRKMAFFTKFCHCQGLYFRDVLVPLNSIAANLK